MKRVLLRQTEKLRRPGFRKTISSTHPSTLLEQVLTLLGALATRIQNFCHLSTEQRGDPEAFIEKVGGMCRTVQSSCAREADAFFLCLTPSSSLLACEHQR